MADAVPRGKVGFLIGRVALWALTLLLVLGAVSARAGTVWYVNPKAEERPRDGTTWNRGFFTVHDALDAARAGDEIWIREGEYIPSRGSSTISNCHFLISKDVVLRGGFVGTEPSLADRSADPADHPTVLEGNYPLDPQHRKKHVGGDEHRRRKNPLCIRKRR